MATMSKILWTINDKIKQNKIKCAHSDMIHYIQRNLLYPDRREFFGSKVLLKITILHPPFLYTLFYVPLISGDIWRALKLNRASSLQMHDIWTLLCSFYLSLFINFHFLMQSRCNGGQENINCLKVELLDSWNAFEISLCD